MALQSIHDLSDKQIAAFHRPVLRFDRSEPFLPLKLGFSVHRRDGKSLSANHMVTLNGGSVAIEYAIWYDWDIQHLYDLEHIWVFLDASGHILRVEASAHGKIREVRDSKNGLPVKDGRVHAYAEPGKHAIFGAVEELLSRRALTDDSCQSCEKRTAILIPEMLHGDLGGLTLYDYHLAFKYLESCQFEPSYTFENTVDLTTVDLLPWQELKTDIPIRVRAELDRLRTSATGVKAVFLDSGDTLIDEGSQVFGEGELVLTAEEIPGGSALVNELKQQGYLVALVADGLRKSFENVHAALGFWDLFDTRVISEELGVTKPDPLMFKTAVKALGLTQHDHNGCVMVGNNLERDIAGANRLNMRSVWINWTTRYPTDPQNKDEVPDFTIGHPLEVLDILKVIEDEAN